MNKTITNSGREFTDQRYEAATSRCIENADPIIATYAMFLGNKQKSTITRYVNIAADFLAYAKEQTGEEDINKLFQNRAMNAVTVMCYLKTPRKKKIKTISNNTFNLRKRELSKFFDFLIMNGNTDKNLCDGIDPAKAIPKNKKESLTKQEIRLLISNAAHPERLSCSWRQREALTEMKEMWVIFLKLGIMTGARLSELSNLTYSAFDWEDKSVTYIQKGGEEKTSVLTDPMIELLQDFEPKGRAMLKKIQERYDDPEIKKPSGAIGVPEDQLFFTQTGCRMSQRYVDAKLEALAEGIDKTVTCHTLRHTCGSRACEEVGMDGAKEVLGHKSIMTTQLYVHPDKRKKRRAASYIEEIFEGAEMNSEKLNEGQEWK